MSSFLKKVFGYPTEPSQTQEENKQETETEIGQENDEEQKESNHNTLNCKAIIAPYIEIKERNFLKECPNLFDKNEKINFENLNEFFKKEVEDYQHSLIQYNDNFRHSEANKSGGIDFNNKDVTSKCRGIATEILKQLGKKIISGDFNLTTVSLPISIMIPISMVQACAFSLFQLPYYMCLAEGKDVIEKLKFTIVSTISSFFGSSFFVKPLNPILGETYEGYFGDGSEFFVEQSSHHPPISQYLVYGPNKKYIYSGYSSFSSSAGLNSISVVNKGKRYVKFDDGTKFEFNFFNESISNSFWGTMKHETIGDIVYIEKEKNISCKVTIGMNKNEPNDYLYGEILLNNQCVSILRGSYMSYIEFDGKRYWDIRQNFPIRVIEKEKNLPSSALFREDRRLLERGKFGKAQEAKEKIEIIQRNDRKLRKEYGK